MFLKSCDRNSGVPRSCSTQSGIQTTGGIEFGMVFLGADFPGGFVIPSC